ncbi:glutamine amidotransferase [Paeniglutamicibacter cryotolerans]|uniref:Glutamine amidotransferase n=2 Tax=Paeniglutamicibacter cryotolerans TaxID=670079 RepID=A0A839QLU7_9MICC|nr:glutamine amidotransferase [Paeniglutamicibacter cryotolerans]
MHAGPEPTKASFWLLQAPDSLVKQSRYEPDGAGIGTFTVAGVPVISKEPLSALHDSTFAYEAKHLEGTTFLAHVRYASTGGHTVENTHPFEQDGRLFAHNGVVHGLGELDDRIELRGGSGLVLGQTDSERIFALITAEIRQAGGDVETGMTAALTWIAATRPVYSLNLILASPTDLWVLRYPETHELYVLEKPDGHHGSPHVRSSRIRAHVPVLANGRAVIIATEKMNEDPGWRLLLPGELLHVERSMAVSSSFPLPDSPAIPLGLADLDATAAASQHSLPAV